MHLKNALYSPDFVNLLLKRPIAYLPLWTIFLGTALYGPNFKRSNNARIERSFKAKKDAVRNAYKVIGEMGKVKLGRYVKFEERRLDLLYKEVALRIPRRTASRRRKTAGDDSLSQKDISTQQENWSKKVRKEPPKKRATFLDKTAAMAYLKKPTARKALKRLTKKRLEM